MDRDKLWEEEFLPVFKNYQYGADQSRSLRSSDITHLGSVFHYLYADDDIRCMVYMEDGIAYTEDSVALPCIIYRESAVMVYAKGREITVARYEQPYINCPEIAIRESSSFNMEEIHKIANQVKLYLKPIRTACLFTGSFNPPTIAHNHVIETVMDGGNFDFMVIAACTQAFLEKKMARKGEGLCIQEEDRIKLLLEMTKDRPDVLVYGIECGYTYDVLNDVKETYGINDLYFILGSDKLCEIAKWGNHGRLLSEFSFYIMQRDEDKRYIEDKCRELFRKTHYKIELEYDNGTCSMIAYKDISSTKVRDFMAHEKDYSELVTEDVYRALQQM